jgi:hypothetical protein
MFTVFLLFCYFLPLEKDVPFYLNKLEFPHPKDDLCQVWLKLAQCFWSRSRKSTDFGPISWHSVWVFFPRLFYSFHLFFRIFNFFGLSITEETLLIKMRIWYIKIGIVLDLHFNPWVEASAGGL